ncbi:uncharacterized protein LOC122400559 [Colletes gigas]|uniref:uncharacterized protein LOC122400559 n=1 Tax=Colletes gigas TaxID=935657 RepID=UPI001C9B3DF3|nr:uncharacterized protein LOC122400559 [Colletes gigas]
MIRKIVRSRDIKKLKMGNSSIDESRMRLFFLSCFLLICSVNGFTLPDMIENITSAAENIQNVTDAVQDATSNMDFDVTLSVFDDDGNIVKLNFSTDYTEIENRFNRGLEDSVLFYLYTRLTRNNPERLYVNNVNALRGSHFAAWKPTKIVTHGWMNSYLAKSVTLVRDAFLQHGDYNVIAVDWGTIAKTPYIWASNRVLAVAKYISSMIDFLETQGMDASQLTTVGHSLGGHIAGLSALNAKSQPKYVVGLDPALPNFWTADSGRRISRGDGKYVLIIHTNAGLLGYKAPIGDIDFYPNGGNTQTGCDLDVVGACSHSRAIYYFAESINSVSGFWGVRCNDHKIFKADNCLLGSRVLMGGIEPNIHATGVYYLETARTPPFAIRLADHSLLSNFQTVCVFKLQILVAEMLLGEARKFPFLHWCTVTSPFRTQHCGLHISGYCVISGCCVVVLLIVWCGESSSCLALLKSSSVYAAVLPVVPLCGAIAVVAPNPANLCPPGDDGLVSCIKEDQIGTTSIINSRNMKAQLLASLLIICSISGSYGEPAVYDDDGNLVPLNDTGDTTEINTTEINTTAENPELLYLHDVDALKKSNFSTSKQTKMITHGWMNSYKTSQIVTLRDAFLQKGDYNVIVIDWSKLSKTIYPYAVKQVITVGKYVSSMIDFLQKQGMDVSRLTIAGHSLGAHIAGLAGHYAKSKVKYIVGLDPALPRLDNTEPGERIARGDAEYVMIIHTNAGLLGYVKPIGDIDFYPNGGSNQKGCMLDLAGACSHYRAVLYYAESINSQTGFWGRLCDSYENYKEGDCNSEPQTPMGGIVPNLRAFGSYYLETSGRSPYALGHSFLENGDYNVILIDWSRISKTPYSYASHQVITVGKYVSSMIDFLQEQGMDVSQLTIAGHSLGGHVAGLAGHYANSTVNYIVGLDPALPNFQFAKPGSRISASDAQYVTIIHTNAGFLGFETEIGDSDFYPNGGSAQIGCAPDILGACSHYRSCLYFAEAINSEKGFWGTLCNNFTNYIQGLCTSDPEGPMGTVDPLFNVIGMYYLETATKYPYALGHRTFYF